MLGVAHCNHNKPLNINFFGKQISNIFFPILFSDEIRHFYMKNVVRMMYVFPWYLEQMKPETCAILLQ